ncbi:MAG: hypothetical protein WCH34_18625 [Bacteroidota bacterium]
MLFYNPNIRRKTTYKRLVVFGKPQERKLYSYSFFENFQEIELVFDEKITKRFEFNPMTNFLDSLHIYEVNEKFKNRFYFDITLQDNNILEFKESFFERNKQARCKGRLVCETNNQKNNCILSFHRVDSYLGYRIKLKIKRNGVGDFSVEEFYDSKTNELMYILENEFEYFVNELEIKANNILNNGWSRFE